MTESGCSTNLEEERLKSFLLQLHSESGILNRLVYKNKNQHRRCPYFQALLKVQRDLRLLQSAGLEDILSVLFAIIDGKQPAQKAYVSKQQKKKNHSRRHNYQERLLGVARLLSQMAEPILQAAIQISFLLAKSFFKGFSLTIMALLARLRVLVQQVLLDVVLVFNKVSSLSQKKHSVKISQEGIEAFREYYPSVGDVLTLECVWKEEQFLLLESTDNSKMQNQKEDQEALPMETSIQYETLQLISEDQHNEHEEICSLDTQPAVNLSGDESATRIIESGDATGSQKFQTEEPHSEEQLFASGGLVPSPKPSERQREPSKKVAFLPVKMPRCSDVDMHGSSKKVKLDPLCCSALKNDNLFRDLPLNSSTDSTLFEGNLLQIDDK
ncbi:uncharacterized protein M6B38_353405 [Iris pallida]|uniref:Nucleolus and neural progenitor protein-like N-terminal domain-containing protein n=1 Tax=Iris pallida TaxID=29817 RepID=A0AAX6GQM9_IRIPA|nr:uncharacterized protein M6B38_353405 [Iris pallida]